MVAVLQPIGEVVMRPTVFLHTEVDLERLAYAILALGEDTRVVMEATGRYHEPVAAALHEYGIYVTVLNPILIHRSGGCSVRKVKFDKKDALKIAKYGLDNWVNLREYAPVDVVRQQLKLCCRQYALHMKSVISHKNSLMAIPHKKIFRKIPICDKKSMNKQMSLSAFDDELAQVRTKKKEFLAKIDRIIPWGEWLTLIRPHNNKEERGNKPYDLELMLRIYLLQNLYNLSDEGCVAEVIDSRAFSEFCRVDSSNQIPNVDTLGRFRNLLIASGLQEKLFTQVVKMLMAKGLILKKGTIVDSTIIAAPSSTQNKDKARDPEAKSTKKGNTCHFGYKAHIGVAKDNELVHTVVGTSANKHDVTQTEHLLTGEKETVNGDARYIGANKRNSHYSKQARKEDKV